MLRTSVVNTSHADISVTQSSGTGMPIVFIHGNSGCKEVFAKQFASTLADKYRLIAFDLPGHGASGNANNPDATYTMTGYANATMELMDQLGVSEAAVVGWSLGGHIGIELMPRFQGLIGLMVAGTPPVSPTPEGLQSGFRPHSAVALIGKADLTDEEAEIFGEAVYGDEITTKFRAALRRTDGVARAKMFEGIFSGATSDQRELATTSKTPIALVNGADDPIVNTDYLSGLDYAQLWDRHSYILRGEGHVPFLSNPELFNPILERFADDMAERAKQGRKQGSRAVAAA